MLCDHICVSARNDAMEDRYSVLIKLEDRMSADGFYCSYNGKRFKPTEVLTTVLTRSFTCRNHHLLILGWCNTFRLRFAIYILLNPSSTPTLQRLLIYLHRIIQNCPRVLFALVSHFSNLISNLLFRFSTGICLCFHMVFCSLCLPVKAT